MPVTAGSLLSRLSDILSQMMSTSRSKVCFTLMLSLALASKCSKPAGRGDGDRERLRLRLCEADPVNPFISSCQDTSRLRSDRQLKPQSVLPPYSLSFHALPSFISGLKLSLVTVKLCDTLRCFRFWGLPERNCTLGSSLWDLHNF